jgi:glycine/D-amino acid oxidase-like deaminating enzyme
MSQITGLESTYTVLNRREHRRLGFGQSVQAVIYNQLEGQIHSGYLIQAMEAKALSLGIRIEYGSNVLDLKENSKVMEITIQTLLGTYSMISKETIVCTNAWISTLVPQIDIKPGRGQIIVTSPIENLSFTGAFHVDEGYYYFRNIGKRVLLGGGRNLDFEGESTHEFASTDIIQQALLEMLKEEILPGKSFTIEYNWSGIMGFSKDKQSIVQRVSPHCSIAFGCNGMGIALGSLIGEQVIELLS